MWTPLHAPNSRFFLCVFPSDTHSIFWRSCLLAFVQNQKSLTKKLSTMSRCSCFWSALESIFGILEYDRSSDWLLPEFDSKLITFDFWYGAKNRSLSSMSECSIILSLRWVLTNSTISRSLVNIFRPFLK